MIDHRDPGGTPPDDFEPRDTLPADAPTVDPYDGIAGVEVPRVQTPLNGATLRWAIEGGHHFAMAADASPARLRAAWCMLAVEHGGVPPGGREGLPCWNLWNNDLGNIDASKDWHGDWFLLTAPEDLPGGRRNLTKRLRAHEDAVSGAADYWRLLQEPRFAIPHPVDEPIHVFEAMDVTAFGQVADALKAGGYFTAAAADYAAGMLAWSHVYDRSFGR